MQHAQRGGTGNLKGGRRSPPIAGAAAVSDEESEGEAAGDEAVQDQGQGPHLVFYSGSEVFKQRRSRTRLTFQRSL